MNYRACFTNNFFVVNTRDLKTTYSIRLADHFDVTCDEILRGIKSENVAISAATGLSDAAIDVLKDIKADEGSSMRTEAVNFMISSDVFFEFIDTIHEKYFMKMQVVLAELATMQDQVRVARGELQELEPNSIRIDTNRPKKKYAEEHKVSVDPKKVKYMYQYEIAELAKQLAAEYEESIGNTEGGAANGQRNPTEE